ncbi:C39 family peptidase [Aidingimonas lacisalsi]|uniref:C39 family peptidase n=1 Tax=Aidingimonas lacisalsi TaxID=2604086 RepID=UPI0011D1B38E|nr:C39 family peptidase [Aidingimonas lacisalsi]
MKKLITGIMAATVLTASFQMMNVSSAYAGSVNIAGSFGSFQVPSKSLVELRWDRVVPQQYDYSCGSAAVATLLTYHYDRETSEAEVFDLMFASGDKEKIQQHGFSMLDMKRYLDAQNLDSDGFRIELDDFIRIGVPAITLINTGGYKHFVVIKGMDEDRVLVGDPAVGTVVVPKEHFRKLWDGTVLGARREMELAQLHFNHEDDWRIRPDSPLKQGMRRSGVGSALLGLPGDNEMGK